ncbi:MAG: hypothetical protein KC635_22100 [Myxococcales bacterium]|nr:hypothetical protein [Myxococcales bacterium]
MPWRLLLTILAAAGLLALAAPGLPVRAAADGAPDAPAARAIVVDDAVTLVVPSAMADEVAPLQDGAHLLTETVGAATLTLVVYTGKKPPSAYAALKVHTDELEKATGADGAVKRLKLPFLGGRRAARELVYTARGAEHVARVVAHHGKGWTVVLTTSAPVTDHDADAEVTRRTALIEVR